MFKKSFVSLFFTQKKLQVLQLGSGKKGVRKFATFDLPQGLIVNHKVQDSASLAAVVKSAWKRVGVREKAVGLVIPEFSTFSKNMLMPKMELEELDEAVRWEAQEFLPGDARDMVMDWKIVKEQENSFQVMVVAIRKDILRGYVDATALAGLFPLVVETPSLSLVRVGTGPEGRLIVYNNFDETVLIISEGETIFGSSVVASENHDEIIRTANQIISHYKDVKVDKIALGGVGVEKALYDRLEKALGRTIEWMKPNIRGLSTEQVQDYLIPISLQWKNPAEPADEKTVNLLPPSLVKRYERSKLRLQIWSLTLIVSYIVWVSFFATLGVYLFFRQEISSLRSKATFPETPPGTVEILGEINEINKVSEKVLKIDGLAAPPQLVFNSIFRARPPGVNILRYKFDFDTGKIEVGGISADRQALIDFKTGLEKTNDFSLVEIPISSFEKESDLEFSLSFVYLPAIKEK